MAIYEYQYTDKEGRTRTEERFFKMDERPQFISVYDPETGEKYTAEFIMSVNASMDRNWNDWWGRVGPKR